jgi:hypothetical protein
VTPGPPHKAAAWKSRHSLGGDHDPDRFRRDLGLPDDPEGMTLDQLDQLIAYHQSLCERYDAALDRVIAVREQIEARRCLQAALVLNAIRPALGGPNPWHDRRQ